MVSVDIGGMGDCWYFFPQYFVFKLIITNLSVKILIFFFFLSDFDLALLKQVGSVSNYAPITPGSLIEVV